jgi:ubiquinone/menaquinone biosynthesis C-methylase UbiE
MSFQNNKRSGGRSKRTAKPFTNSRVPRENNFANKRDFGNHSRLRDQEYPRRDPEERRDFRPQRENSFRNNSDRHYNNRPPREDNYPRPEREFREDRGNARDNFEDRTRSMYSGRSGQSYGGRDSRPQRSYEDKPRYDGRDRDQPRNFEPRIDERREDYNKFKPAPKNYGSGSGRTDYPKKPSTSWGHVADKYQKMTEDAGSHHEITLKPALLKLLGNGEGKSLLDVGCGTGYFAKVFKENGYIVTGVDIAEESIALAKQESPDIIYHAGNLELIKLENNFDVITIILALQNIDTIESIINTCSNYLNKGGKLVIVLNHPYYRIPSGSSWEYSDTENKAFRRVDKYLIPFMKPIVMNPASSKPVVTYSFHRPLGTYIDLLLKSGLTITKIEELESKRPADQGPKTEELERVRHEIPLFMNIICSK